MLRTDCSKLRLPARPVVRQQRSGRHEPVVSPEAFGSLVIRLAPPAADPSRSIPAHSVSNGGCAFTAKGRRICAFVPAIFDDLLSISPASSASMADIDADNAGDAGDAGDNAGDLGESGQFCRKRAKNTVFLKVFGGCKRWKPA